MTANAYTFCDKMYAVMDTAFSDWLVDEIEKREWSQSKLAKKANISRQAISDYINQRRKPDNEALRSIARALGISEQKAFYIAGEMTYQPGTDEDFEELKHLFSQMTEAEQEEFLAQGRLKLELRNKRGEHRDTSKARPAHART